MATHPPPLSSDVSTTRTTLSFFDELDRPVRIVHPLHTEYGLFQSSAPSPIPSGPPHAT